MIEINKEIKLLYPNATNEKELIGLLFADLSLKNSIIDNKNQQVEALQADIADKDSKILSLQYQVANLNKYRFSRRSEKLDINQPWLFPELLEDELKSDKPETKKVKSYNRKVNHNNSLTLPANTPIIEVNHKEELQLCKLCDSEMVYSTKLIQYRIAHVPASTIIIKDIRWQQKCINCCPDEGDSLILTAPIRGDVLYDTICTPTFLASVLVDRIQYNLPLFRIEHRFNLPNKQIISRQVLSTWLIKAYSRLQGLKRALERRILTYPMLSADETNYPCINSDRKKELQKERTDKLKILETFDKNSLDYEKKKKNLKIPSPSIIKNAMKCFMMVRATTNTDGSRGLVVYNYFEKRDNDTIRDFVGDYKGFLLTDGLISYSSIAKESTSTFSHGTCLVHASRKTKAILEASPNNKIAINLLEHYTVIFHNNNQLIDQRKKGEFIDDNEFMITRRKILTPLFKQLKETLESYNNNHFVSDHLKKAINYPLKRWEELLNFMNYPFGEITNNYSEQKIKSIILGRKASLFSNTPQGARATAFFYSLVESCKAMGVDTYSYLTYVLSNSRGIHTDEEWEAMLPGVVDLSNTKEYIENLTKKASPDKKRTTAYIIRGKKERTSF